MLCDRRGGLTSAKFTRRVCQPDFQEPCVKTERLERSDLGV